MDIGTVLSILLIFLTAGAIADRPTGIIGQYQSAGYLVKLTFNA